MVRSKKVVKIELEEEESNESKPTPRDSLTIRETLGLITEPRPKHDADMMKLFAMRT